MTTTQDKKRHTQGPWHVGAGNGEGSIFADNGRTRLEIGGTTLYPIARMGKGWNEEEDGANARLIAAAPELLQIARDYVLLCQLHDIEGAVLDSALAAVAKVEGRGE